ncbi:MAG: YraN family protein [Puniceicoccales bacterium]|nr:YraN family protein [Puniceicoccales bacterium]
MKQWWQTMRDWCLERLRWRGKRRLTPRMQTGRAGERHAAAHLRAQGWGIVARNWQNGRDEIDIVARDGPSLVFIEVKTRASTGAVDEAGMGYFAVNARKRRALSRACRAYLSGLASKPAHFRFDIIEVKIKGDGTHELVHHRGIPLFPKHYRP